MKQIIRTDNAPAPVGPYSQAVVAQGKLLFVSGQIALDPQTGKMVAGGVAEQARQCLENLKAVVEAAGASLRDVVKTTVLLASIEDYATVNGIYAEYFSDAPPARAAFGGLSLPANALVEIECIVVLPED